MTASSPAVVVETDAEAFWFLGALARIRVSMDATGNQFDMVELLHPQGYASPLHSHQDDNEVFLVLEGTMRAVCDDAELVARAGDTLWLPKGTVHGYAASGDEPLRMIAMTIPGNFSGFVREAGTPAARLELPPADLPIDFDKVVEIAAKYGIAIVGPPVTHLTGAI